MSELAHILSSGVSFHLADGSTARRNFLVPEDQLAVPFVEKLISQARKGNHGISVDSLDDLKGMEIEIFPEHIVAFVVYP